MNAKRRKTLKTIATRLEHLDALRAEIVAELENILDEEQDAFDNMPESIQNSERGDQMQEYIYTLGDAISELEYCDIERVVDALNEI
jgi:hypothetical protein